MEINVHHYFHARDEVITGMLEVLSAQVAGLADKVDGLVAAQQQEETRMTQAVQDLTAEVAAQTTITGSLNTLIPGILAKYADLTAQLEAAAGDTTATAAAVAELKAHNAALQAAAEQLTAAVTIGTPATPAPAPTPAADPVPGVGVGG